MIKRLKPKSEFSRNVLTLMTGTTIAQAIPIAISPILTRMYTPEDFGVFALFFSLTSILGVMATGRYELAIILPKYEKDSTAILFLSIIVSLISSLSLLIIILIFFSEISNILNISMNLSYWLYLVPVSVLLTGLFQSLSLWNNKARNYKTMAKSRVLQNIGMGITSITFGKTGFGAIGLIVGHLLGQLIGTFYLMQVALKHKIFYNFKINKIKLFYFAKKYSRLPKYDLLASLAAIASQQLLPILFLSYFNAAIAGYIYLTQRVMSAPVNLISAAILEVFREQALKDYLKHGHAKKIYSSTFKKLVILSFIPSLIIYYYSVDIFILVFGAEWEIAGEYAQILTPMLFLRFISSPLSFMFYIASKENINLIMQVLLLCVVFSSFFLGHSDKETVFGISLIFSLFYLIQIIVSAKLAKIY